MRWQDMSFKLKMGIAFGFILVLMGLIGTITYFGIRKVEATGETATRASQLETLMAQREIDHLQWVRQVNDFLMRDGGQLTVQTDHQLCGLGKWLHGPQRAEAEAKFPKLIPLLKALEAPHHTVHQSAISIKAAASQGDDKKTAFAVYQDTTLPALEAVSKVLHDIETEVSATAQAALQEQTTTAESVHHTATTLSIIGILLGIGTAFFFSRYCIRSLARTMDFAGLLSKGDFTQTLAMNQKDEFGHLAEALNQTVRDLGGMLAEVSQGVGQIHAAFDQLDEVTKGVSQDAEASAGKAVDVSAATTQMSSNMDTVAAASEEATTNMSMVSDAAKEMAATVGEIAENTEKARAITLEAVSQTQTASTKVDQLGVSAREIVKVTEVIT
jgi:methyl-accepting chemotaxis protein